MEVNLIERTLPAIDRTNRTHRRRSLSDSEREVLCRFEGDYFDGEVGYGGYHYDGRHAPAVRAMVERFGLTAQSSVLDVGCAKGFVLVEFARLGVSDVHGCDISRYAVSHAHEQVRDRLAVMSADRLAYADDAFDVVICVDVIHNLPEPACDRAIREMMRVARGRFFLQVASFETADEEQRLREWGVTVKTFRSKQAWRDAFDRLGYAGDYFFKTF